MARYLLSLDVGTTAIKVGLFSADGALLKMANREQTLAFPEPGRVEQSPGEGWRLLAECSREVMAGYDSREVGATAISNHRGTAIALDRNGDPLSEFVVWMDKRGVPEVEWLLEHIGGQTYYNVCGHPVVSYTGVSKVLWFQRSASEVWERAAVIAPPQTVFLKWLGCDDLVCDVSTGTYLFPFDIDRQTWSDSLARQIGIPLDKLPRLVGAADVVGYLSPKAAGELGLTAGIPLVAGGGDGQCAGVGSGIIKAGRVMVNVGTGTGVQAFLPAPRRDPDCTLNCAAHVVTGAWEMEGHTQSSGAAFRWLRDEFGSEEKATQEKTAINAYDLLVDQAKNAPPGSDGLLFIPTFNGSSAPVVDLTARGCLLGLSLSHTRGHVIRALLEGISLEIRWMLNAMIEMGTSIEDIRLVGGGASNPFWNQIHADILGHPVTTLHVANAAMVGAAICAAMGVGLYEDWSDAADRFVQIKDTIDPQQANRGVYEQSYQNYRDVFRLLSREGVFKRL
jgi:xylulokinase